MQFKKTWPGVPGLATDKKLIHVLTNEGTSEWHLALNMQVTNAVTGLFSRSNFKINNVAYLHWPLD